MIYKEKFVSDEIISKLPNWLIHFLWFLLEGCVQNDADFDGCFTLRRIPEGQHIACTVNGRPFRWICRVHLPLTPQFRSCTRQNGW